MRRYILGDVQSEDMFINGMGIWGDILYVHWWLGVWCGFELGLILYVLSVVGNNTYSIYTKMGARIHRTVALLRVCEWIQLWNLSAWVKFARGIFGEILYWHSVLVIIHIWLTQKWASGSDPPLRSGRHTERIYVYKLERVYGFYIERIHRCW